MWALFIYTTVACIGTYSCYPTQDWRLLLNNIPSETSCNYVAWQLDINTNRYRCVFIKG